MKFKLYKGNIIKAGTTSPYSLYSESLASFTTGDLYDHHDADGFITLFGLPLKVRAMKMQALRESEGREIILTKIAINILTPGKFSPGRLFLLCTLSHKMPSHIE